MNINELSKDSILIKIVEYEDKIIEIESIAKILNIWIKENDYEIYPIAKMLNEKISEAKSIAR